jgi:hypothetical protein
LRGTDISKIFKRLSLLEGTYKKAPFLCWKNGAPNHVARRNIFDYANILPAIRQYLTPNFLFVKHLGAKELVFAIRHQP